MGVDALVAGRRRRWFGACGRARQKVKKGRQCVENLREYLRQGSCMIRVSPFWQCFKLPCAVLPFRNLHPDPGGQL